LKVYIAAPWIHKQDAIKVGQRLGVLDIEVTSSWFHHEGNSNDSAGVTADTQSIRVQALQDIADVLRSDYIVVLNLSKSEGKAVETGIAIAG